MPFAILWISLSTPSAEDISATGWRSITICRASLGVDYALSCSVIGGPDTVKRGLASFIEFTASDELMITANLYSHAARLRSFEIVAEIGVSV